MRTIDPETDARTYSNTAAFSGWLDISYMLKHQVSALGLFLGGTLNLGSRDLLAINPLTKRPILFNFLPVVDDLKSVFRISPRYTWFKDPLRFGLEVEMTRAAYGKPNRFAKIGRSDPVTNIRILFALFYAF